MNKQDIIQKVHALGFPIEDFWLVTGGAMVLYGIKNETHDIDLGCSKRLADRLETEGYLAKRYPDGTRKFEMPGNIELFENWLFDHVDSIDGIPIISIKGLIMMKESLGRAKDKEDLTLIREFLTHQQKHA
ncbi:MAG: hypothetical protein II481_06530 [Clostridia bacterium]|nr:hypothetical protein [Clostridia bacterium]